MSQKGRGGRLPRGQSKRSAERKDKVAHPNVGRHKGERTRRLKDTVRK